jgi:hypothetical protein
MLSPRRTQGIEIHNAIADDEGTGYRPPRKKTTPQTQSVCAGNRRQVPDGEFFLAYGQHTITRDKWIPPLHDNTLSRGFYRAKLPYFSFSQAIMHENKSGF